MPLGDLFQAVPVSLSAWVFLLGLCIGSFLNVVIVRLPRMMEQTWRRECAEFLGQQADAEEETITLSKPPSHCPSCKAPVKPWQNIPVISYLLLRGRCATCQTHISALYPLVELATAVLSVLVFMHFGWTWQAAAALVVTWLLVAMTVIDLRHQLLPDNLTLPMLWGGLILSLTGLFTNPTDSIIGAALGYGCLWLIYVVFKWITGKEGMGHGDFKLFAAFGALLGWQALPMIVLLSSLVGTLVATGLLAVGKLAEDRAIPFGPFIAGAGWISLVAGEHIMAGYWQLMS